MSEETSPFDLLEFPLDYEFKAFGPNHEAFEEALFIAVGEIVQVSRHALRSRASSKSSYRCVTILVRLQSKEQLRAVYGKLRSVDGLSYLL